MKKRTKFKNNIDELIYNFIIDNKLDSSWNIERRDYYKLEKDKPEFFKDKGRKSGIMYLGDIDDEHYMDINIIEEDTTGYGNYSTTVKMLFRRSDDEILFINSSKFDQDINLILTIFFDSINEYIKLVEIFSDLRRGIIPTKSLRNYKLNNILDESL